MERSARRKAKPPKTTTIDNSPATKTGLAYQRKTASEIIRATRIAPPNPS
ncbi:hypothetical protein STP4a_251 [Salmonella phage STP4-a]|uniref:Uncharacterized protein n=1 Tax=Salmonella phage STP4-a TaxID=1445860 RepID=A0A0B4LA12_9CAUD|nr:hypothetical protein STP4a_251 [Salmonella phage STP4-a]AHJ86848.1 hypothetical protein STP4a_251 [Salmonella phage STP4-a]